ncbi:MAG: DUF3016 domain-containing protein [Kangiellaceae bacterium]|nr:DUF3016 domain-containing protein [Kangiellaceae bacterium]
MKHFNISPMKLLVLAITALSLSTFASASVKIELIEGKKFTDYELSGQSRQRSLNTIKKDLHELFSDLSMDYIKENQSLEIDITNIDLPGYIHYTFGHSSQDIRIIRGSDFYRVYFTFRVKSEDGTIVRQGEYQLKEFLDLNSSIHRRRHNSRGNVSYYEQPLKEWFKETFAS